ncbi:MAG: SIR2 family protein [Prevotellaceae bacterium]|nr:SIR2 family protein [Candidatus Faecinaster equi]
MAGISRSKLLKDFSSAVIQGNAAIFAGAGFSATAGFVDWKGLIRDLANEIGLDVEREYDMVALSQYYDNVHGRADVTRAIFDNFTRKAKLDDNHLILASLPISTYWTTNFDSLLEDGLRKCGKRVDVKSRNEDFQNTLRDRSAVVYKMHGDILHPDDTILLKKEFEDYASKHAVFHSALTTDLMNKVFLFLGFSFTDPNLNYVLSRLRYNQGGNNRVHFNITRKVNRNDYKSDESFEYELRKQELFVNDLEKNYNIQTYLVDEYYEINKILKDLQRRNDRRTIYISGAAEEYLPWDPDTTKAFILELSASIIKAGYKIVTGYGLGVGSLVIAGALEEIYKDEDGIVSDQIIMRPFPIGADKTKVDTKRYRRDMIKNTGITLFLLGNKKKDDGTIGLSDGMDEELNWSKEQNNLLIPVGSTGYKASEYYQELVNNYPDPEYIRYEAEYKVIGDNTKSPAEIVEAIMNIIIEANK